MKKQMFYIFFIIITKEIFFFFFGCYNEKNVTFCQKYKVNSGFSCLKIPTNFEMIPSSHCLYVPSNQEDNEKFVKLFNGLNKMKKDFDDPNKWNYDEKPPGDFLSFSKGEIKFSYNINIFSDSDKNILKKLNTCYSYNNNYKEESEGTNGIIYTDIPEKDKCFQTDNFEDLNGLINCGCGEIKQLINGNVEKVRKICLPMPAKEMPEYLKSHYFKTIYDGIFKNGVLSNLLGSNNKYSYQFEI